MGMIEDVSPIIPSKSFKVLKTLIPIVVYDVAGNYKPYNG